MLKSFAELCLATFKKDQLSSSESELYRHSHDESHHAGVEPDYVFFPESTEDVRKMTEIATQFEISMTAFGVGSGLEGQAIPLQKGVSINFERMNKVIEFSPEDMLITVQPGITRLELNSVVNKHGLYFPIDPGADATIGGMVATNASGTTAVRYGSMRDQLLDLEVVLANGTVLHTGTKAKKSSSGLHLTGLFAGSEGTLGFITEVSLKLHGIPEHSIAATCTFADPKLCAEAANIILMSGIPVLRIEFVDALSIKQVNQYGNYTIPEEHSLFIEFAGMQKAVEEEVLLAESLLEEMGSKRWKVATESTERAQLWKARHEMSYAFRHNKGTQVTDGDVCVPISKLPILVEYARELINESGLQGGILGHIGDGNFHTLIMFDPTSTDEFQKAETINSKLAEKAIEFGGTCTGEHGVGIGKKKYQLKEHGEALAIMKSVKQLFDPKNLMNPQKIFD
ncbi:FAD-binding oxidoreductase [Planomicrobium sp. YIM 101495]|uniref:FAD-binding oxidoreductase n=1 Tax=Planomicrobium sp. YIM 101495 TaxID=2665160 RepID=UPI0012B8D412|nr:FAD-linked oxidase C-terminal domain-containing protein [Planomicrobium sp. YIM 101495]MTD30660.1 FAD-binding protein [Planomicrobium sp. YIM 101495]